MEEKRPPDQMVLMGKPQAYDERPDTAWMGKEPAVAPQDIKQTVRADVIVVGAGIAGLCAARAAAEEGVSVVLVEKSGHFNARSGQYAVPGGKINEYFGRPAVDPDTVTDRFMRESGYKVKRPIISRWAKHANEVFDWYIAAKPDMYIARRSDEQIPPEHRRFYLAPLSWPLPEAYDYTKEEFPVYRNSLIFVPGHAPLLKAILDMCTEKLGVRVYYGHAAEKLEQADGRFTGVLARDVKGGGYVRFEAKKSVILATGDNAGDPNIIRRFMPWVLENGIPLTPMRTNDLEGKLINTGDGLKMGARAGLRVQQYHAVMSHNMGVMFMGMGTTPFLFLNKWGRRFMNECVPGQQLQDQLEIQPDSTLYQVFDDNWRNQLQYMPPHHGSSCGYAGEDGPDFFGEHVTEKQFRLGLEKGVIVRGETPEELFGKLDIDKEEALRSVQRYNELARSGHDDDFNKPAGRMFPLEKGPFYATTFGLSPMLCCIGGLESDENCHVFAQDGNIVPGLYTAGNVMGNIYAGEYPICMRGLSHSMCMFYGYVAGKNAAGGI